MPKCPKISIPAGSDVAIVEITGNPRNMEPAHVRIVFPGGHVEVTRASNGPGADYWIHVGINHPQDFAVLNDDAAASRVTDARIDIKGKHASETNAGDFAHPEVYHVAMRVTRREK